MHSISALLVAGGRHAIWLGVYSHWALSEYVRNEHVSTKPRTISAEKDSEGSQRTEEAPVSVFSCGSGVRLTYGGL